MKSKLFLLALVAIMAVSLLGASAASPAASTKVTIDSLQPREPLAVKFDAHYRVPRDEDVEKMLVNSQAIQIGMTRVQIQQLVTQYKQNFIKSNPPTADPRKLQALLDAERMGTLVKSNGYAVYPQYMSLVVPVEFNTASETFDDDCGNPVTFAGPLHNEVPAPGPYDNNTIWYDNVTSALYNELYFATGPNAGVILNHPNLGAVDLRGNTMANYYLEQSEGTYVPKGEIYPTWLLASHSEAWYGTDGDCSNGSHNIRAQALVAETIDLLNADDPTFGWQQFDADGDGFVDNFTVIHAGVGQESGGGVQGNFAIWSHASFVNAPFGVLACTAGSAGCPDRDIYVGSYSMDPEHIDIGVIAEEYGHAMFGLPDIYTTDYQASPSNWAIMESGSWNGPIAGMQPAPFPLWFRYVIGWANPVVLDYNTSATTIKVGQLSLRPKNTAQGIKVNLPNTEISTDNLAGTGNGWWVGNQDYVDLSLAHDFDLTTAVAPITFSFSSVWGIETDYDYGYVEVSTDGGTTWTPLDDIGSFFAPDVYTGAPALTDYGSGILSFDLSAYAGSQVSVRLRYVSDLFVQYEGWWADDFLLTDNTGTLFADNVDPADAGWVNNGFTLVPFFTSYPLYYLAEWRNLSGFDRGLAYPYQTVYSDADNWEVDRCAYTAPGMLLWLRNGAYGFDYTLNDASLNESPSVGPKHALLVLDSHYFPMTWSNYQYSTGAYRRISSRCQPANATFTLQPTTPFTIRLGFDPVTGIYDDPSLPARETKTFGPDPAVSQFHDSLGYYPGFYYPGSGAYIYYWQLEASAVVPAQGDYSYRVTDMNQASYYGSSGNPGDDGVQYGLHMAVTSQDRNGTWGRITVWNSPALGNIDVTANRSQVNPGDKITYKIMLTNTSATPQTFVIDNPIPAGTTYFRGKYYDAGTNAIHYTGRLSPHASRVLTFIVVVNPGTEGTTISDLATFLDNALGGSDQLDIQVLQ